MLAMDLEVQRCAADVFHRDIMGNAIRVLGLEFCFANLVDGDDMRMIQGRRCSCFTDESAHSIGIGYERRWKDLQRDRAIEPGVGGFVDLAHTARADRLDYLVVSESRSSCEGHFVLSSVIAARLYQKSIKVRFL